MFGMKKNVFQKADLVKQMIANSLGRDCTDREVLSLLSKASSFDKGVTKSASDEVRIVLSKLRSRSINPNTAYKYVKVSLVPANIKEKVYGRKISTRKALMMVSSRDAHRLVELENVIFEQGMKAIRGLKKCH